MKIRLAKKIWARSIDRLSPYWSIKLLQCKIDNRIVQAAKRVTKWEANNLKNRLEKSVRITPSQAKEIRRSVELLNCSPSDLLSAAKQQLKRKEMEKKVLTLTVSKQWFDKIVAGEKTEEYREIKPYWIKRLTTNCEVAYDVAAETHCGEVLYRPYTHVLFINGYRKDSPRIEKEIDSITIGKPKKGLCPDKWLDTEFFIIKFK